MYKRGARILLKIQYQHGDCVEFDSICRFELATVEGKVHPVTYHEGTEGE
jgi:hypothetical protein